MISMNSSKIQIRPYEQKDMAAIRSLVSSVLIELFGSAHGLEDLDAISQQFAAFFVAVNGTELIGTLGIKDESDARISRMYVAKHYRNQGIGRLLFQAAMKYCKQQNYRRIFLTTYPQMHASSFYERMGFVVYHRDERIWMEKKIE